MAISIALPSLTFSATALAAKREGLWVEFEDVDHLTWTHPAVAGFGVPSYGRYLDAAAAFGEQMVMLDQMAVFSLHATKPIGAGEGGFIVTHNPKLAEKFRRQTNFGIDEGISKEWGTNYKMSEYHAAVALASLDNWDREPWLHLYDWYDNYLPSLVLPQERQRGVYPILGVLLPMGADIEEVRHQMLLRGVETRRWYWPLMHKHPMFSGQGDPPHLPITEDISEHLIGLPYHLFLSKDDVAYVCHALEDALTKEE